MKKFFASGEHSIDDEDEYIYFKVKKNKAKDKKIEYTKGIQRVETDEIQKHFQLQRQWRNYLIFISIITIFSITGCILFGGYMIIFQTPFLSLSQIRVASLGGIGNRNSSLGTLMLFECENPNLVPIYIEQLYLDVSIVTPTISYKIPEFVYGEYNISNRNMEINNKKTEFRATKLYNLGINYSQIRNIYFTGQYSIDVIGKIEYKILNLFKFKHDIKYNQNLYNYKK